MQLSYQECYQQFNKSYGQFENWPLPYNYMVWFSALPVQFQQCYLHSNNYCYLYEWARQLNKVKNSNQKKPSRAQKRKLKKKQLQQEYKQQEALIGKWVLKQRKDLIDQLKKIQQQQNKIKQKRQKKLSHLIQIHKQVYKHHMKRKNPIIQNSNKRAQKNNKKKRMSIIKKMKSIFQNRKQKIAKVPQKQLQQKPQIIVQNTKDGENKQFPKLDSTHDESVKQKTNQQIIEKDEDYEDISSDQQNQKISKKQKQKSNSQKENNVIKPLPNVSFPISQIKYKNIGKLSGKMYNEISLRQWVTNIPNSELEDLALKVINRLAYKQAIKKVNNPQKAKKIIVSGLKQCKRTLTTILQNKKSKCLVVALNIQRNNLIKGVDDELQKCITLGQQLKIPVIHISTRSKLGRAFTGKFGPRLSVISIINYQGYQDYVQQLLKIWKISCQEYDKVS